MLIVRYILSRFPHAPLDVRSLYGNCITNSIDCLLYINDSDCLKFQHNTSPTYCINLFYFRYTI